MQSPQRETLTFGVLTLGIHLEAGRLVEVQLPDEPPEGLTAEMLNEALRTLRAMLVKLPAGVTEFRRRAWEALMEIPVGKAVSYAELAAQLGSPGGARAVGGACSSNRLLLVVPCHRVVAARGLGGFAYGLHWKQTLLALESQACNGLGAGAQETKAQKREAFLVGTGA